MGERDVKVCNWVRIYIMIIIALKGAIIIMVALKGAIRDFTISLRRELSPACMLE